MTKISNHYICEKKGGGGEKRGAQKNRLIETVLFSAHNQKSQ